MTHWNVRMNTNLSRANHNSTMGNSDRKLFLIYKQTKQLGVHGVHVVHSVHGVHVVHSVHGVHGVHDVHGFRNCAVD